ncbi:hypothetical protein CLV24_105119 [Pontibacter ummariensis]|uniref:Uncharacterized protein n=1 Tax=Pontibacter ummariensis TaxID=1610492 RepID=A0A239DU27_9BACT|nr:hypothetical protein [Pontibacter ummariensis]PRY13749.1 hypothetical protein CLV24_105119 [Pontibacter ummariensis]SNS36115.1 hypothetical protein SAMN06296052_105133 [Pontibacter ummariensis]
MAWSTFFGVVIGAYAIYYVLNFLYDLFFSRKQKAPAQSGVHYNMRELMGEEEGPEEVAAEPEEEPAAVYPAERKVAAEPALRVEGQGIPLEDFLKDAKSYSKSIF